MLVVISPNFSVIPNVIIKIKKTKKKLTEYYIINRFFSVKNLKLLHNYQLSSIHHYSVFERLKLSIGIKERNSEVIFKIIKKKKLLCADRLF
jgi:hypothetical protein